MEALREDTTSPDSLHNKCKNGVMKYSFVRLIRFYDWSGQGSEMRPVMRCGQQLNDSGYMFVDSAKCSAYYTTSLPKVNLGV